MEIYNFEALESDHIEINGVFINLHTVAEDKLAKMRERYARKAEDDEEEYISDGYWSAALEAIDRVIEYRREHPEVTLSPLGLLELARSKEVGATVTCPHCKQEFEKRNTQHIFCSNAKTKQGGNCKDRFWNLHDPVRRERLEEIHETQY